MSLINMVRGTRKRRRLARKRRRGQKGGDFLRAGIGKSLPPLFSLYGKLAGFLAKKAMKAKGLKK